MKHDTTTFGLRVNFHRSCRWVVVRFPFLHGARASTLRSGGWHDVLGSWNDGPKYGRKSDILVGYGMMSVKIYFMKLKTKTNYHDVI